MRKLALAFLLCSTPALALPIEYRVENAYNVRHFEVQDFGNGTYALSVIWHDDNESRSAAVQLCQLDDGIRSVRWASVDEYLKSYRDVSRAVVLGDAYYCY